jgi:eukaryotic-like serine/threonine-protein kinase
MPKSAEELFAEALALTDLAQRAALLERECAGNPELREEVESLLAAHEQAGPYFGQSSPTVLAEVSLEKPGDRIGRYKLLQKIGEGGCEAGH